MPLILCYPVDRNELILSPNLKKITISKFVFIKAMLLLIALLTVQLLVGCAPPSLKINTIPCRPS